MPVDPDIARIDAALAELDRATRGETPPALALEFAREVSADTDVKITSARLATIAVSFGTAYAMALMPTNVRPATKADYTLLGALAGGVFGYFLGRKRR